MNISSDMLELLASRLGIDDFDVLIVGDGAGSFVHTSCGWYCVSYDRRSKEVVEHFGGANGGTNNYAELEPGVFALWSIRHVLWANHVKANGNKGDAAPQLPRVVIVSDSEVTVKCGNNEYSRRANAPLWASIHWFEDKGYKLRWVHVPRNSNPINTKADQMAKSIRSYFQSFQS